MTDVGELNDLELSGGEQRLGGTYWQVLAICYSICCKLYAYLCGDAAVFPCRLSFRATRMVVNPPCNLGLASTGELAVSSTHSYRKKHDVVCDVN